MRSSHNIIKACAIALVRSSAFAADVSVDLAIKVPPPRPALTLRAQSKLAASAGLAAPVVEWPSSAAIANAGFDTKDAFSAPSVPSPNSTNLSPPVTLTYSGGSPVLLVNDNGTNKGVELLITNSQNQTSALFGQTNRSGAGLTGYDSGTGGPAGKFGIINSNSFQPAVTATTNGYGPALQGTVTNSNSIQPAVFAITAGSVPAIIGSMTSTASSADRVAGVEGSSRADFGFGVEGDAYGSNGAGVVGHSYSIGVFGEGPYIGVLGQGEGNGYGVYGTTQGSGNNGEAGVFGESLNSGAYGVLGHSISGYAVVAEDSANGVGLYASSQTGLAAYFVGDAIIAGQLTVDTTVYQSDKRLKQGFQAIDSKDLLDCIMELPVTSWVYKKDAVRRHIGPMAQDFHAAFGLNGTDDTHINVTDIAGVSLAAIKELGTRIARDDIELANLKSQLAEQVELVADVKRQNAQVLARLAALPSASRITRQQ